MEIWIVVNWALRRMPHHSLMEPHNDIVHIGISGMIVVIVDIGTIHAIGCQLGFRAAPVGKRTTVVDASGGRKTRQNLEEEDH